MKILRKRDQAIIALSLAVIDEVAKLEKLTMDSDNANALFFASESIGVATGIYPETMTDEQE